MFEPSINLQQLKLNIEPLRQKLINHPVYSKLKTIEDLSIFMEHHIFAVWDFMSLLKSLQNHLTCVQVPWIPKGDPETRYLINEIVTGEESDLDEEGNRMSHFELYLKAMEQCGCDCSPVHEFVSQISEGISVNKALKISNIKENIIKFVSSTFETIELQKPHVLAASFTFGREDLIPGMFITFVKELSEHANEKVSVFQYYLERHIEVDGDHHSALAYQMMEKLCGTDEIKWQEATNEVKKALLARLEFWDSILEQITLETVHST